MILKARLVRFGHPDVALSTRSGKELTRGPIPDEKRKLLSFDRKRNTVGGYFYAHRDGDKIVLDGVASDQEW